MKKMFFFYLVFISTFSAAENFKDPPMKFDSTKYVENLEVQKSVKIIQFPKPYFPTKAIKVKQQGWCVSKFNLSESGVPEDIKVIECSPSGFFEKACLTETEQLRFSQAGTPAKGIIFMCNFALKSN